MQIAVIGAVDATPKEYDAAQVFGCLISGVAPTGMVPDDFTIPLR